MFVQVSKVHPGLYHFKESHEQCKKMVVTVKLISDKSKFPIALQHHTADAIKLDKA